MNISANEAKRMLTPVGWLLVSRQLKAVASKCEKWLIQKAGYFYTRTEA